MEVLNQANNSVVDGCPEQQKVEDRHESFHKGIQGICCKRECSGNGHWNHAGGSLHFRREKPGS